MKKYIKCIVIVVLLLTTFLIINKDNIFNTKPNYDPEIKNIINNEEDVTTTLKEKYKNNDIVGTISIPNTDINEVLVQTTNNKYYLTHDIYKNNDQYGSVFLDYRCNENSKKLLIFGHNDYKDKTPFSELENYYNKEYFDNHQYIDIIINNNKKQYQIFSVYIETSDFTYMNLKINSSEYESDLLKYKKNSFYKTNTKVSKDDKILILQTCSNHQKYKKYKDKYLLIIAKQKSS